MRAEMAVGVRGTAGMLRQARHARGSAPRASRVEAHRSCDCGRRRSGVFQFSPALALMMLQPLAAGASGDAPKVKEDSRARNAENVAAARGAIGSASGGGIVLGLTYLGVRAFQRRAELARGNRLASTADPPPAWKAPPSREPAASEEPPSVGAALGSGALAAGIGIALYACANAGTAALGRWRSELPDVLPVRNLAAAVSTLAEGLLYLLAFVFIISGAGLALLGVQTMTNNTGGAGEAAGSEERKPPMDGEDDT